MRRVIKGINDLASQRPDLVAEWDYDKNKDLKPDEVTSGSSKKVWWICNKGHEWQASVSNRAKNRGCPYCAHKRLLKGFNDLQTLYPDVAKDWDIKKNEPITSADVLAGSNKKFWWKCHNCGYEWETSANARTCGHGCPYCAKKRRIAANQKRNLIIGQNDLRTVAPQLLEEWDYKKNGSLKPEDFTAGSGVKVWWKCKKYGHSWQAIIGSRVKGAGCPYCHAHTSFPEQAVYYYISQVYPNAVNSDQHLGIELDIYIPELHTAIEYDGVRYHSKRTKKDEEKNRKCREQQIRLIRIREQGLCSYEDCDIIWLKGNPSDEELDAAIEKVLSLLHLQLDVDLSRDKNKIIDAYHQYEINHSLSKMFPEIALEWNYGKNGRLTPEMFSYGSTNKVWWKCIKGHEWQETINNRTSKKFGCPYCTGKRAIPGETDFATVYPDLLKEWDFDKNKKIDPHTILPKVNKLVWWKCSKGHEWQATVNSRTNMRSGCPFCSGRFAEPGVNDLATTNPECLAEWSYEKNKIKPTEIKAGSEQKVWWHCKKCGHDWQATPYAHILAHTGCPYCANQVLSYTKQKREGMEVMSKAGQRMKLIRYRKAIDVDIQFEDGTIIEHRNFFNFLKGAIKNPNYNPRRK